MKILKVVSLLILALCVADCSFAAQAPKAAGKSGIRAHALPRIARVVVLSPKFAAVGLKDTLGGILFTAEAGVDVVHAGTTALSKAAGMELKKNPFEYVDKGVAYVDTGLEKAALFFFQAQI
jgi:hypothetical protein